MIQRTWVGLIKKKISMIYFLVLFLGGDQANHPLTNQHGLKAKITTRVKGITKKCHPKHFPPYPYSLLG